MPTRYQQQQQLVTVSDSGWASPNSVLRQATQYASWNVEVYFILA